MTRRLKDQPPDVGASGGCKSTLPGGFCATSEYSAKPSRAQLADTETIERAGGDLRRALAALDAGLYIAAWRYACTAALLLDAVTRPEP